MYLGLEFFLTLMIAIIIVIEAIINIRKWLRKKWDDKEYDKFLERPFDVEFLIPKKDTYKIKYYKQDNEEHKSQSINLPPNFKDVIFILLNPRENFETDEIYYGFDTINGGIKPKIISYKNPFIKKSNLEEPRFYKDWWDDFHLVKQKKYFRPEVYVTAFEIGTHDEGTYNLYIKLSISCDQFKSIKERRQKKVTITHLRVIVQP